MLDKCAVGGWKTCCSDLQHEERRIGIAFARIALSSRVAAAAADDDAADDDAAAAAAAAAA